VTKREKGNPGPKPKSVAVEGNWEQAVSKALKKKRPGDWQKRVRKPKK